MAHHDETPPPREGEARTAIAGLRQVAADGHAARIQQVVLIHCIERLGGRVEIPVEKLHELTGDVVITGGVSDKDGSKLIVATIRRG